MGQFEAATIRPQLSFSFPTGPFLHSFRVADNPGTTLIREALLPGCPSSAPNRIRYIQLSCNQGFEPVSAILHLTSILFQQASVELVSGRRGGFTGRDGAANPGEGE